MDAILLKMACIIIPILFGVVCYFIKKICDKVDTIGDNLSDFKLEIAKEYATKNELNNFFAEMKSHDKDIIVQLLDTIKKENNRG